ncbi:Ras-like GTP-binding protein rhoA [Aphelenchoides bicaudatus]|nr:Ras-like GTP-binding protein rhoA [Aphelenchoides bicaudatus]
MENISKKLIVVGDGECGKTSLLIRYGMDKFYEGHVPTVFDSYVVDVQIGTEETLKLSLFDTAGQEEHDRLRTLSYPNTDVILMCFSIASPKSLESVLTKWTPEMHHCCKKVPMILVGTKKDLRDDLRTTRRLAEQDQSPVSLDQARAVAKSIKAVDYIECSSKDKRGIDEVMAKAIELSLKPRKSKKGFCSFL